VQYDLVPKEWGGTTQVLKISAHKKTGLQELLKNVINRSEQMNLTYNTQDQAQGVVLDTYMDKGKGLITSLLVRNGVLSTNNSIVILNNCGKIRSMFNTEYAKISYATPSMNINVTGLVEVSKAGDIFYALCMDRRMKNVSTNTASKDVNISTTASMKFSKVLSNRINYIVKTDTYGSLEAITQGLMLINKEYKVNIINLVYGNIGNVSESDINLALITKANILSFNVQTSHREKSLTKKENVVTENYKLIYNLLHDVSNKAEKLISINSKNIYIGKARVEKVFNTSLEMNILGCYVLNGKITKDSIIKIFRNKTFIEECKIDNLKRFKNDVSQVDKGLECGIVLSNRIKIDVNDTLECYSI
jgi:translation initiation factor IF-2